MTKEISTTKRVFNRRLFSLLLALFPFLWLVFFIINFNVNVPVWDQWELIPLLEKSYQGTLSFFDLWTQHNEHRLFFPKIIMINMARFSSWDISYELAANILFAVGIFLALLYQIKITMRSAGDPGANWLAAATSLMVFSLAQWGNWFFGWQMQIFMNVFFVVVGIILLAKPVFKWSNFGAASLLGIAASYSFANGLCYWFIGLLILFFIPNPTNTKRLSMLLWLIISFLVFYLYLYGYHKPLHHPSLSVIFKHPLPYFMFVFLWLGLPLGLSYLAILFGIFGFFVLAYFSFFLMRFRNIKLQTLIPYFAFSLYAITSALLTAWGRAGAGISEALPSRYISISTLFWVSNIVLLSLFVCGDDSKMESHKPKKLAYSSIFIIVFLIILHSAAGSWNAIQNYYYLLPARHELLALKNDELLKRLYPDATLLKERVVILKKYHLSIFK